MLGVVRFRHVAVAFLSFLSLHVECGRVLDWLTLFFIVLLFGSFDFDPLAVDVMLVFLRKNDLNCFRVLESEESEASWLVWSAFVADHDEMGNCSIKGKVRYYV